MPLNLSIRNVDRRLVDRLRQRAARYHRSLQGELLAIMEESAYSDALLTPEELPVRLRRVGLHTPDESAKMIRADRDAR